MQFTEDSLYNIVSFLGAVQGILLASVFLLKKSRHASSVALGFYLLIFSAGLLERFVQDNVEGTAGRIMLAFLSFSNFLYGPLLYLFIHFLTIRRPRFKWSSILHFLPFVIGFLLSLISPLLAIEPDTTGIQEVILFELLVLQILTYNILAIRKLHRYEQSIVQLYSNFAKQDLSWLKVWLWLITAAYIISIAITHAIVFGWEQGRQLYIIVQLLITVSIYMMSYRMILYPSLLSFELRENPSAKGKYQKSGLKSETADQYTQQLRDCMADRKPYLDPDLNIFQLSEMLGISRHHLTEIVNKSLSKNFYEFINEYRVQEVKRLMCDPRYSHLTLSAIGFEAGFKSKSAFNTNFKSITGLTPSQWKKNESRTENFKVKEAST